MILSTAIFNSSTFKQTIMKKLFLLICLGFSFTLLEAQSPKYNSAMKEQIAKLDGAFQAGNFPELANNFERIGNAEKNQWLPYYYAAYCQVMAAYFEQDKSKVDPIADKADSLITKAESLSAGATSETNVIRSMIASAHMIVDPQQRWMQYGQTSAGYIEKAKSLDPTNPRPIYLDGQAKFYTPEQFGGGKTVAAPVFEKALAMFDGFK